MGGRRRGGGCRGARGSGSWMTPGGGGRKVPGSGTPTTGALSSCEDEQGLMPTDETPPNGPDDGGLYPCHELNQTIRSKHPSKAG